MVVKVSAAQRRGRLVERQLLGSAGGTAAGGAGESPTVAQVAEALVALHATDPVTVYLSLWARSGCTAEAVDSALYTERSVVRVLGMRRTVFVVPAELAGVVQAACTDDVAQRLRRALEKELAKGDVGDGDPAGWLRALEDDVLRALAARGGHATGAQLSADEPGLRTQLTVSPDKSYGGTFNITSRVLTLVSAEGRMIRGNRRGGWTSGQFEWFLPQAWLPGEGCEDRLGAGLDAETARADLARRWLTAFGPALPSDLQWWAGWTGGQTKAALGALPVTEVDLDGQAGVGLAGDLEFGPEGEGRGAGGAGNGAAVLLPALDPTPMGWQSRSWYLGPHAPTLFDRTGNIGPTVWWAGRVAGGWAQHASGGVVFRLLEDIGAEGAAAVAAQAARLEAWLGAHRIKARFRAPLEKELSGYS